MKDYAPKEYAKKDEMPLVLEIIGAGAFVLCLLSLMYIILGA